MGLCTAALALVTYDGVAEDRAARPAENPTPAIKVSDSWTYQVFDATGAPAGRIIAVAVQVQDTSVRVQYRIEGSLNKTADDVFDSEGRMIQEGNPFTGEVVRFSPPRIISAWPLGPGKEWTVDTRAQAADWNCELRNRYKVIGWEKVTVPAGTFDAIKVTWTADIRQGSWRDGTTFSGTETGTYWHLPKARAVARIDYENTLGVKYRRELVVYHLD
jgi:hypothetical protein